MPGGVMFGAASLPVSLKIYLVLTLPATFWAGVDITGGTSLLGIINNYRFHSFALYTLTGCLIPSNTLGMCFVMVLVTTVRILGLDSR